MRYYFEKPKIYMTMYGEIYKCDHPVYNYGTLFKIGEKGICVIQQRYDSSSKHTYWGCIDDWLRDKLYLNKNFKEYFDKIAKEPDNNLYPTVSIRQIMWALKMKPIKRELWETVFDRRYI